MPRYLEGFHGQKGRNQILLILILDLFLFSSNPSWTYFLFSDHWVLWRRIHKSFRVMVRAKVNRTGLSSKSIGSEEAQPSSSQYLGWVCCPPVPPRQTVELPAQPCNFSKSKFLLTNESTGLFIPQRVMLF